MQSVDEGKVTFQCKNVVKNCPWEVAGKSEEEILPKIKEHGRTSHNIQSFDRETEDKVRLAIHRDAARLRLLRAGKGHCKQEDIHSN